MPKAVWTLTMRRRTVGADGTAVLHAELADRGVKAADVVVTVTADRQVRLDWTASPGADPLTDFQAWAGVA